MGRLLAHLPALVVFVVAVLIAASADAQPARARDGEAAIRVKDLGRLQGWRENALVGYGIVTGLAGTGDSPGNRTTRQALANVFSQFNLTVAPEQVQSRNVAVVMVSAALSPFAREGDTLDITVSSAGDARSLLGGSLLLTPLRAADGRVHALAQGALAVGGYRHDALGNVVQKNHPTVGNVPGGATVEVAVRDGAQAPPSQVTFVLHDADFTTASRVAAAINRQLGVQVAEPRDGAGIDVRLPEGARERPVEFLARLEAVTVEPDRRARVVINERTGTVVITGDVEISPVVISHKGLTISTVLPAPLPSPRNPVVKTTEVVALDTANAGGAKLQDLMNMLDQLKVPVQDRIDILKELDKSSKLHAKLMFE